MEPKPEPREPEDTPASGIEQQVQDLREKLAAQTPLEGRPLVTSPASSSLTLKGELLPLGESPRLKALGESRSFHYREYSPKSGESSTAAIANSVAIANSTQEPVLCVFNGNPLVLMPGDNPETEDKKFIIINTLRDQSTRVKTDPQ